MEVSEKLRQPVEEQPPLALKDEAPSKLEEGVALCLSGGGYRAMLFHVGAIVRLNQIGALAKLRRVSSVSGGSITAAILGRNWAQLEWDETLSHVKDDSLNRLLVQPIRHLAGKTIDVTSIGMGALLPWQTISEALEGAYKSHLLGDSDLQDLPDERPVDLAKKLPAAPRFVFVATNVKTGSLWRFAKPFMADYRVGMVDHPKVTLAAVVAASSAFPPFLSPMRMSLDGFEFRPGVPDQPVARSLRAEAVLTDGGVYDNLGLEPVWKRFKTVLISDGGRSMADDLQPADDWARHSRRLIDLLQRQTSSLRRRQAIAAFRGDIDPHEGTYWGIQTNIDDYGLPSALPCPHGKTIRIAEIDTRLAAMSDTDQERIMNWGYAVCDAAMRKYVRSHQNAAPPVGFPFPRTGL